MFPLLPHSVLEGSPTLHEQHSIKSLAGHWDVVETEPWPFILFNKYQWNIYRVPQASGSKEGSRAPLGTQQPTKHTQPFTLRQSALLETGQTINK